MLALFSVISFTLIVSLSGGAVQQEQIIGEKTGGPDSSCALSNEDLLTCVQRTAGQVGTLRPSDLPAHEVFTDWASRKGRQNGTIRIPHYAKPLHVAHGSILQSSAADSFELHAADGQAAFYGGGGREAKFSVLKSIVNKSEIQGMLKLLRRLESQFDTDPDSVDGMPTFEIYTEKPDAEWEANDMATSHMRVIGNPKRGMGRDPLRKILQRRARAILEERITPYVRQAFPQACGRGIGRACTPCYSLIRRYREGERQSHGVHHDGHAIVTVVVSLSEYGVDYRGGLYVTTSRGKKKFLALRKGDAVVHQSDLYHGVQVLPVLSTQGEEKNEATSRYNWGDDGGHDSDSDSDNDYMASEEKLGTESSRLERAVRRRRRRRRRKRKSEEQKPQLNSEGSPNSDNLAPQKSTSRQHTAGAAFLKARRLAGLDKTSSISSMRKGQRKPKKSGDEQQRKKKKKKNDTSRLKQRKKIQKTERWSWILWYRDSDTCEDHGYQWFEECAHAGVAVCQKLYATKLGTRPQGGSVDEVLLWNQKAADGGDATASVKVARAYLGLLPSPLTKDKRMAVKMFRNAIEYAKEPDAYYGLAEILIASIDKMAFHPVQGTSESREKASQHVSLIRCNFVFYLAHSTVNYKEC